MGFSKSSQDAEHNNKDTSVLNIDFNNMKYNHKPKRWPMSHQMHPQSNNQSSVISYNSLNTIMQYMIIHTILIVNYIENLYLMKSLSSYNILQFFQFCGFKSLPNLIINSLLPSTITLQVFYFLNIRSEQNILPQV